MILIRGSLIRTGNDMAKSKPKWRKHFAVKHSCGNFTYLGNARSDVEFVARLHNAKIVRVWVKEIGRRKPKRK